MPAPNKQGWTQVTIKPFAGEIESWERIFSIMPRRTINGKIAFGKLYRWYTWEVGNAGGGMGLLVKTVKYATAKEHFLLQLKKNIV